MKAAVWILLLITALGSFVTMSAQLRFQHIDITSGLSQNSVTRVLKDSEGYYWIGTHNGLNRFDGKKFEIFRHNRADSTTLTDNFIIDIGEDAYGQIWVATRHCLNRYNKKNGTFSNITRTPDTHNFAGHNTVYKLAFDKKGNCYFTSIGKLFCIVKEQLTEAAPRIDTLMSSASGGFALDHDETICFLSDSSLYLCPAEKINQVKYHERYSITEGAKCGRAYSYSFDGKVYISSCDGLYLLDKKKRRLNKLFGNALSDVVVYALHRDHQQRLWIATDKGLYIGSEEDGALTKIKSTPEYPYALKSENITSISMTSDSLLWIGSSGNGVFVLDQKASGISFVNRYNHPELLSENFSGLCYRSGKLYAGTDKGIAVFDSSLKLLNQWLRDESVSSLTTDEQGDLWAATSNGLFQLNARGQVVNKWNKHNSPLRSNKVFGLCYRQPSQLWMATEMGLYLMNTANNTIRFVKCSPAHGTQNLGYILSVNYDTKGRVWACHNFGASVIDPVSLSFYNYEYNESKPHSVSHRLVSAFYNDKKNNLWFGTLGGGLNHLDERSGRFMSYELKDGICSDFVTALTEDSQGALWIGTSSGISRFNGAGSRFQNYSSSDGLVGEEIAWGSMVILPKNRLVAAGPAGLNVLDLSILTTVPSLKAPVISSLMVDNKPLQNYTDTLILADNIHKILIEPAYPDLRMGKTILYEYKVEGLDKSYDRLSPGQKTLFLSNLPFGQYTLSIRVTDNKLRSVSGEKRIFIQVIPPFWKTNWFLVLMIATGTGLIVLGFVTYLRKRHKEELRKIEIEHKVHIERERISQDLHDNIGAQLTYIIYSLDSLKYEAEKDKKAVGALQSLEELSAFSKNTVQQLRDTIWALSGERITVDEFAQRVRSYTRNYLTPHKNIGFSLSVEGNSERILSAVQLLNSFRIIQESVNNIVKHADASEIEFHLSCNASHFSVIIRDNGKGLDERGVKRGHGLKNMELRSKKMKGKLTIESTQGKGTSIVLVTPFETT